MSDSKTEKKKLSKLSDHGLMDKTIVLEDGTSYTYVSCASRNSGRYIGVRSTDGKLGSFNLSEVKEVQK